MFKLCLLFVCLVLDAVHSQNGNGYPRQQSNGYDDEFNGYEYGNGNNNGMMGSIPGVAGQDYPTYTEAPKTSFQCASQQFPGYYADPEAQCQAFHICQRGNRQDSFVCPIGTLFNQEFLVCDWWYNVNCNRARDFYQVNELITREMEEATMRLQNAARQGGYNYPNPGQQYLPPN